MAPISVNDLRATQKRALKEIITLPRPFPYFYMLTKTGNECSGVLTFYVDNSFLSVNNFEFDTIYSDGKSKKWTRSIYCFT